MPAATAIAAFVREMRRDLTASTALARQFLSRQLRAEYRQTLLGGFLAFLPALGLIFWAVLADRAKILDAGRPAFPTPPSCCSASSSGRRSSSRSRCRSRPSPPSARSSPSSTSRPESLILAGLFRTLVNLAPKLVLVALVFVFLRQTVPWTVVLALVPVVVLVLLGTAIGLVLAPLHALYHDVGKGLRRSTTFWFFMTPVLYAVPPKGLFRPLVELNPVTPAPRPGARPRRPRPARELCRGALDDTGDGRSPCRSPGSSTASPCRWCSRRRSSPPGVRRRIGRAQPGSR